MKTFEPLEAKCRSDQVAKRIIRMIESGELKRGDKLPSEPEFARQLGISRGILREGLAQLKAQGIITRKPKDGTYIQPVHTEDSTMEGSVLQALESASRRNILEMRDAIERMAVVLAIERATDEELEELRDYISSVPGEPTDDDVDFYFHYRVVELSGNSIFMSTINTYFEDIRHIRNRNLTDVLRYQQMLEEHKTIVDAMCRRDSTAAVRAVQKHMAGIWTHWQKRQESDGDMETEDDV